MIEQFLKGIFIEECKNRFLCKVLINGSEELCYVSSSSKLERFINLVGREVILINNGGKATRTKYTLHAVFTCRGPILLNLGFINKIIYEKFMSEQSPYYKKGNIFREKKLSQKLKTDFYLEGNINIIIEAKGLISEVETVEIPSMKVERAIVQLLEFIYFLKKGYKVHYCIVIMSPTVHTLQLGSDNTKFNKLFNICIELGMELFIYSIKWNKYNCYIEEATDIKNLIK